MITASRRRAQYATDENSSKLHPVSPSAARDDDTLLPAAPWHFEGARWQALWRDAVTDPHDLLAILGLRDHAELLLPSRSTGFDLRVPRGFVARMRPGDPADPLLLQVLPQAAELVAVAGFGTDAVGDLAASVAPGLLRKYAGRALLVATGACAVHCRYCFRRHFPYADATATVGRWDRTIAHLRTDPDIVEIILSGGDPLSLSTPKLAELTEALATVPHLRRLRIHTRLPIVLPERVDSELGDWLAGVPWPTAVVLHANHPNELDASVAAACMRLRSTGATVLNQSVLLRNINDSCATLEALSARLFDCGVVPYYLHQLDRTAGTAHFEVDDDRALELAAGMRARLPGYLVPRLVRETAGEIAKTPL